MKIQIVTKITKIT